MLHLLGMRFELATEGDLDAVMAIERDPAYALFIGGFERARHTANRRDPDWRYLVWREDGGVAAFVLFDRMTEPDRIVRAYRIAARTPGAGLGRRFLPALIDWVFERTDVHRLELDCSMENARALRVYAREGFVREGVAREVYRTPEGRFVSSAMLSMLRPEWAALPRRACNTFQPSGSKPRPS